MEMILNFIGNVIQYAVIGFVIIFVVLLILSHRKGDQDH